MTTFQEALEPKCYEIVNTIDISYGLLPKLLASGVLTRKHVDDIEAEKTETSKAEKLLKLLERRPPKLLPSFCKALEETSQSHVVDLLSLETNDGLTPSSAPLPDICPVPTDKLDELKQIIEPDYGFPDYLCGLDVITDEQRQNINEAKLEVYSKVERLLAAVTGKLMDRRLHEALIETYQEHVSNFIKARGDTSAILDDIRPIDGQQQRFILCISHIGLESFNNNPLLDKMVDNQCISYLQKLHVASLGDIIERNQRLIRIMLRRSLRDYKMFLRCVKVTQRKELVESLSKIGALALIKSTVKGETEEDTLVIEGRMIGLFNSYVAPLLLLPKQVYAVFVGRKNSIDWYFNCRDVESLERLKNFYESEELLACLEDVASRCKLDGNLEQRAEAYVTDDMLAQCQNVKPLSLGCETRVKLEVIWEISDYERCRDYLNSATYAELSSVFDPGVDTNLQGDTVRGVINWDSKYEIERRYALRQQQRMALDDGVRGRGRGVDQAECGTSTSSVLIDSSTSKPPDQFEVSSAGVKPVIEKDLPFELLELILKMAAVVLFKHSMKSTSDADNHAVVTVSSVCRRWWQVLAGREFIRRLIRKAFDYGSKSRGAVRGVATLGNQLFVTSYGRTLAVFDLTSCSQQQNIELQRGVAIADIATCKVTRRIYIADYGNSCVWHIDWSSSSSAGVVTDNVVPANPFIHFPGHELWRLSTHEGRRQLLVTGLNDTLYVYDVNGKLLRRVELSPFDEDGFTRLYETANAVQAATGDTYFVCRYKQDPTPPHTIDSYAEVAEYDANGQPLRFVELCNPFKSGALDIYDSNRFSRPICLALIDDERLLFANSRRVLVLNTRSKLLQLERVLLTEEQLKYNEYGTMPQRLCYNSQTRLLCVGFSDGLVNVYKIS